MGRSKIDTILQSLRALEEELEGELELMLQQKQQLFRYHLEKGRVRFEQGVKALQKQQEIRLWSYIRNAQLSHIMTAPIIYSLLLPFILIDIFVTIYQQICFRIYGIPRVLRSDYIIIDRYQLGYLNILQKINCVYCGYVNGLIDYIREISARTEAYWCPIKHAQRTLDPHQHYTQFSDYGDAKAYFSQLKSDQKNP